ncbi:MAG: hypothetical protein JJT78_17050, partial [Leptospira sp.]|nr:hypothetical protein [Leptospira sp.]
MKYKIKIMGVLLLCNCLAFNENDLDPTSNPIWTLLNLAELQRLENIEFIPEIQLKLLDSSLPESEQNASIQYAFRKKQKMELPENIPAFDLDDHFFSYSQFFSSDSILRLQGLGSHTFDLYTVEESETIKIGVLEFELSINSNKDSLNFNFQPEMGMERFVLEIENVRIDSKSKQEFHYGSALISYYDGEGFYGAFTELDQDFSLDEFNGKQYLMKSDDGLQFRILEETTDFGLGYRKNSSNGRYDFSEYSQKFNDNSFSLTEDGFLSLNRFRNRSGCEDIVCFAPTLEPETVHMQEYRQGQLIHQYIPVAIEETYLLRNLLGYFQGYTFAFGTDASSLYRADNRSFR